jgi:hypothetical protein
VVGDAVWREIPIREDLQGHYERCWQTAVNAILESNFAIAIFYYTIYFMDDRDPLRLRASICRRT